MLYHTHLCETTQQDYHSIYDTPSVRDGDGEEWKEYLRAAVLFLVLSPNSNHQQDMLFRVAEYKKLEELPAFKVCLCLPASRTYMCVSSVYLLDPRRCVSEEVFALGAFWLRLR